MDNINSYSTIEIPVNINNTHFTQTNTPILHIDLSSNNLQQQLNIEQLLNENRKLHSNACEYEQAVLSAYSDNNALSNELNYLQNNIKSIDKQIEELTTKILNQQQIYETKVDTLNYKLQYLQSKKQLLQTQSTTSSSSISNDHRNKSNYLSLKFNNDKYTEDYVIKCLSSDILDFNSYTKIEADTKMPIIITKIIPLLQDIIASLGYIEYKLRIFGSYATGLSLPSSELDLVVVASTPIVNEHTLLQRLCSKVNEKKGFQCTFVEKFIWPFIVCTCSKEFNNIVVNISVQDNNCKHKGLQCIELIGRYVNMYPILEPVIIVIKQILKYGNVLNYYVSYVNVYIYVYVYREESIHMLCFLWLCFSCNIS